jgi:hypothetical protein
MLSHRLAMPREWYLDQCFHMFGYLKRHDRWTMVFDETEPNIDPSWFTKCDCAELYPYAKEATPPISRGRLRLHVGGLGNDDLRDALL